MLIITVCILMSLVGNCVYSELIIDEVWFCVKNSEVKLLVQVTM